MTNTESITEKRISRRRFVTRVGEIGFGAAAVAMIAGCGGSSSSSSTSTTTQTSDSQIINAAATAEALATVMYDNIIKSSPAYAKLGAIGNVNDQAYLVAGREQEVIHYNTLVQNGAVPLATTFYFPVGMFSDTTYATTINTLVTLEDAFIAAYLIAIRDLSTSALKVLAGQIMGVECEHRAFGRVIAADLGLGSTKGLSGVSELTNGPNHAANNLAFERTFGSTILTISDVVKALGPFVAPGSTGYDTTAYPFNTTANFYNPGTPTVTLDSIAP